MGSRIGALKNLFASKNLDGYLVTGEKNLQYSTDFLGGSMLLVPSEGDSILFVYGVNYEAAKEEARDVHVELVKTGENLDQMISERIGRLGLRHVGFDSLKVSTYLKMRSLLKETELETADDLVWSLRKVKDETELRLIKSAANLTSRGMRKAAKILEAGLTEREVAAEVEYEMRKAGSDGVAFESIVSSGPDSAFPHGGRGEREIGKGEFVVIDIGAKVRGYCADLTRTFVIGEPSSKQAEIYRIVKEAQNLAVNKIHAGIGAKEVDGVAREYIAKIGYGEYFVHSLGHGVGLEVHEPPALGSTSKDVLAAGNVVTVEPGVYIPKFGGVRIEDTVLVLDKGAERMTKAPVSLTS